jgi:putative tryptophan/tyrosine transport system substrate-binding protein
MFGIRRREFITLVGSVAAWPFFAQAQQAAVPVIGFLHAASPRDWGPSVAAFRQGLRETGYIEGQNVIIEIGGRRVTTIGSPIWHPIWSAVRWR